MDSRGTQSGEPALLGIIEEHHLYYEITRLEAPETKVAFDTLDDALQWILRTQAKPQAPTTYASPGRTRLRRG